jgi:hypothetical protein
VSVLPTVVAASRSAAAALLEERRVLDERIFPPEILLPSARHNHDVECFTVGQRDMSLPHSATSLSAT